jgi:hypothetical protein
MHLQCILHITYEGSEQTFAWSHVALADLGCISSTLAAPKLGVSTRSEPLLTPTVTRLGAL